MKCPRCESRPNCWTVLSPSEAVLSCGHRVAPVTLDMQRDTDDDPSGNVTLQRLQGGNQWHCPDVACNWVDSADHGLNGETRRVRWNDDEAALEVIGEDDVMGLSNVCNRCREAKGWTPFWLES